MENSTGTELRNRMISSAISYNKYLDRQKLKQKSSRELMKFVHPRDRNDIDTDYFKLYGHRIAEKIYGENEDI